MFLTNNSNFCCGWFCTCKFFFKKLTFIYRYSDVIQTKPSTATTEPISIIQIKQTLSEKKVKNSMKHTSTPSSSTVNKIITEDAR
jgi:hypothetical protein